MAGNSIGKHFVLTSFGESHGEVVGGVVDGCPAGMCLSLEEIQRQVNRRRPGQSAWATSRNEADEVNILSGLFEGVTTGMPIAFLVTNRDQRQEDYEKLKEVFRPSHADFSWQSKYGIRDYRGGGRASAREHVARVVGGAIARQVLRLKGITIQGYTSQIGSIRVERDYREMELELAATNPVCCPDIGLAKSMMDLIARMKMEKDSVGGVVTCIIRGVPAGVGEPVFDRLQARLAAYMMSINAAKGFEYGAGFHAAEMKGSEHNDTFMLKNGSVCPSTNHAGGILGGVSTGKDIYFRVAFKPVSSIGMVQKTVDAKGKEIELEISGRHDPCVVPRAVPVVEAMASLAVVDLLLERENNLKG